MKIQTSELKESKINKQSEVKKEKATESERRYHPVLDGFFTEEEAKKEIKNRTK